jgi:hypothetical protein
MPSHYLGLLTEFFPRSARIKRQVFDHSCLNIKSPAPQTRDWASRREVKNEILPVLERLARLGDKSQQVRGV